MDKTPLIILSDSPNGFTGLGRITRELSLRISEHMSDKIDLATISFGGDGYTARFPWRQYQSAHPVAGSAPGNLPYCIRDHFGDRAGVIMTIANPAWVSWLADPTLLPAGDLRAFLELPNVQRDLKKWCYVPLDGDGPHAGQLPRSIMMNIHRFDRILAYTQYGSNLIDNHGGVYGEDLTPHLPHGIDTAIWRPKPRSKARADFLLRLTDEDVAVRPESLVVGCVATNTGRKNWELFFRICHELVSRGHDVRAWCHTDKLHAIWNLPELCSEFGMNGRTAMTTSRLSDDDLAWSYSACDVTLAIAAGGGFEYPIAESLACGCPVVHGDYAGGAELVPLQMLVEPIAYHSDGYYMARRPIFNPKDWADRIKAVVDVEAGGFVREDEGRSLLPRYIDWREAWPRWRKWFEEGLAQ